MYNQHGVMPCAVLQAFRLPPPGSGEETRVTPASAVRRTLRLAAMIGGVALVGGAVYFSGRQLLSRFSKS